VCVCVCVCVETVVALSCAAVDARPDLKVGKLGSCPVASTTKGPPRKTVRNYYLGNIKILFETDNLE